MNEQEAVASLCEAGAILSGHFVLHSGLHSDTYVNKDGLYLHTGATSIVCQAIAEHFTPIRYNVDVVVAPAIGGVVLSQWVTHHLNDYWFRARVPHKEILAVYAEKEKEGFVIRRGYDKVVSGRRVLIVEDILTRGDSARKVVEVTRSAGGEVVGLGVICNRGGITTHDVADVPELFALINSLRPSTWELGECPLCSHKVPVNTDVGKGREFLDHQKTN